MRKFFNLKSFFILILSCILLFCACAQNEDISKIYLNQGATYQWVTGKDYTYSTDNAEIAVVDEYGVITGVNPGETTVHAETSLDKISAKIIVKKYALPSYPSSVTYSSETLGNTSSTNLLDSTLTSSEKSTAQIVTQTTQSVNKTSDSTSISSKESSSVQKQVYFTLDALGGTIEDTNWQYNGVCYITYNNVDLPQPTKEGYSFIGWKSKGEIVTQITFGGTAIAEWEELTYQVEYVLNGGTNNALNPSTYGYFDKPFVLNDASKQGEDFIGWYLDNEFTNKTLVIPNTKQKVTLYAKFSTLYTATFVYNNVTYFTKAIINDKFIKPDIPVENGYFIEWFTDELFTKSYNFDLPAKSNINLYGKLYQELTSSFFGYENNKLTKLNNLTELQYYLEYTYFNEITTDNEIEVSQEVYNYLSSLSNSDFTLFLNKASCPFLSISRNFYTRGNKYYFKVIVSKGVPTVFNTHGTNADKTQIDHALKETSSSFVSTRSTDFDDFKYKNFNKYVSVTNSNQLFFALEHGVIPIPEVGSNAEIALNKCKTILKSIINNDMSDYEKVKKIYEYLCYNVSYVLPPNGTPQDQILSYDCFYMEGVLNRGVAVCDGISKTLSALCNIEGIRCVRTASTSHAWNEVFIDGNWYTIDATHGDVSINLNGVNSEFLTYNNFLINEEIKESYGYQDILRTEVIAEGTHNIYANTYFTYNNKQYDFVISSRIEFVVLLNWLKKQDDLYSYQTFTVDFLMNYSFSDFESELSQARSLSSANFSIALTQQNNYYNYPNYVLFLK